MKIILPTSILGYNLKPYILHLKIILHNYYYNYHNIIFIMTSLLPDEEIQLLLNEFNNSDEECNIITLNSDAKNSMSDVLHNLYYGNYGQI